MKFSSRIASLGLVFVGAMSAAAESTPAAGSTPTADAVAAVWQHHQTTINYFGITSSYSCDGLEQRVRQLLLLFGAREDAKVFASCPRGPDVPSHDAWIKSDFFSLTPDAATTSTDAVKARWESREVTARRPAFMEDGDCELIEQMKDLISKSFSLRDLQYRTECIPHEVVLDGFSIKAQVLVALPDGKH